MKIIQQTRDIIKASIGIDLEASGCSALERGLRDRMLRSGLTDEESYLNRLRGSPKELDELVELVVVPETWFFRDEKPLNYLQKYVLEEWLPTKPASPIKTLSIPCSSGEEPYTVTMALLDIGLTIEQFDDLFRSGAAGCVYGGH